MVKRSDLNHDIALAWLSNKNINPLTGRRIKTGGPVYALFERYCKYHNLGDYEDKDITSLESAFEGWSF